MTLHPLDLLEASRGEEYIGEAVSQLDHALQAAHFAAKAGASEAQILAALFHDIGHLCASSEAPRMAGLGVVNHEEIGAAYLEDWGVSEEVRDLIAGHVQAKRYLVARHPRYKGRLSPASTGTLAFQGGPMSDGEADAFERDPRFKAKLAVREWDERAKIVGLEVAGVEAYREMLARDLTQR